MNYIQVDFHIDPIESREICLAFLSQLEFESFEDSESGLKAYIPTDLFSEELIRKQAALIPNVTIRFVANEIEKVNWNEEWEKNFSPVVINEKCGIRAPFHETLNLQYELIIMPKMSFGTGHHATTSLMLRSMIEEDFKSKQVLDAGCGTGVLAIMAEKLHADNVLAYDIDEWAVENSKENIAVNNCKYITVEKASINEITASGFDIILANINKNVLLEEMNRYAEKLNSEGIIFLSGFYFDDIQELTEKASEYNLKQIHSETLNEWAHLKLQKRE